MHSEYFECVIIGGGVVGLAVARECVRRGWQTLVLERHPQIGQELSSHNSEVLHAGIYYPTDSLKARTCVAGHRQWIEDARRRRIPHRICGKWVVASDEPGESRLLALMQQGTDNGAEGLRLAGRAELARMAPELKGIVALVSPRTGIIDSHAALNSLKDEVEAGGGVVACAHQVVGLHAQERTLVVSGPDSQQFEVVCGRLVIANGLGLPELLAHTTGLRPGYQRRYHWAKGHYFSYHGRVPFDRLVYPVPEPGGLGIHLTLDLAGGARFGPDVEWVERPDWRAEPGRHARFVTAIRRYWPGMEPGRLQPAWAGVRPKLAADGRFQDFWVDDCAEHGAPGVWVLAGIESPGLTAAPALASLVAVHMASQ